MRTALRRTPGRLRQGWDRYPWLRRWGPDLVLVGLLLLWILLSATAFGAGALLVGLAQVVPLLWRRRHPLEVALVVAGACLVQVLIVDGPHPANLAVPIAVYSAAAFGDRRTSRVVLGLGLLGAVVAAVDWSLYGISLIDQLSIIAMQAAFLAMFVGLAWVLGDTVRRRKAVVARLQAQNAALARDQSQRTQLAAQDERAAIAREMHDVVAHSLAVVVVQADGAAYAARTALSAPPGGRDRDALHQAVATLETLAGTARESLADTRRLVGVLRDEGAGPDYAPLQGLADLDELVTRVRASGVAVAARVQGRTDDLARATDLAAYRVVQEGLTNVLKHAGPGATAEVDVLRTPAVLLVRVSDDGRGDDGGGGDGEGNGLVGMAERVEVLGGSVHSGPRQRGGWEVVATIPAGVGEDVGGDA